jgi:hypothetical protein
MKVYKVARNNLADKIPVLPGVFIFLVFISEIGS